MNNRAKEPIECQACHKMIEIGQVIANHHITYFPEKIIKVHGRCHGLIHKSKTEFRDLKPDPRQVKRWYKKKGKHFWDHDLYAHEYYWLNWIDCVENGFMTEERISKIHLHELQSYWEKCEIIRERQKRLNIRQEWLASKILSQQ